MYKHWIKYRLQEATFKTFFGISCWNDYNYSDRILRMLTKSLNNIALFYNRKEYRKAVHQARLH